MIDISVIIPTYNRAALVPAAIDSVLAQTRPAAEIIVVDDGSADHTPEVLARYGSKIHALRQPNAGLSGARNAGIRAARSDWVAFLDDDDEYAPDRLARAEESIRRFPAADAHLTNTAVILPDGPPLDLFKVRGLSVTEWMPVAKPLGLVLQGCFFAQSLVARHRALVEIGLFRDTFYEDMDLYVRLSVRAPWIVDACPALRLIRRENTSAMSADWRSKPVRRGEALVRIHREALGLPGLDGTEIRRVRTGLATHLFDLGAAHATAGDRPAARRCFVEAARTFPAFHSRLKAAAAGLGGRPVLALLRRLTRRRQGLVR